MKRRFPEGFWSKSALAKPSSLFQFCLLVTIFGGVISTISLFDWWFRKLHVVSPLFFYAVSFFLWSGIFRIVLNWYQLARIRDAAPKKFTESLGTVAVFLTAAPGEPLSMFRKTFQALSRLEYPCNIYFLDGTGAPEYKSLALEFGLMHLDMVGVEGAKAGKVNEALKKTNEDFVLVLDPDHLVFPDFLKEVMVFFKDPTVGFVQVSQGYYNQYRSPIAQAAAEQTYLFYGPTQCYYGSNGGAIAIGANCMFRRTALASIGGHAHGLAEDLLTSIRLHAQGWKSIYHPVIVNRGLVPEDFDSFSKQQLKWSRGLFEVLFTEYPKLFGKLNMSSRWRYFNIGTFYLVGLRNFFFLLIPVGYFLFGWVAVNMSFSEFVIRSIPFAFFSLMIYALSQRYLVDYSHERGVYWRGMVMKFACWPVYTYAFILTLLNKKIPYLPTSKQGTSKLPVFFWPLVVYLILLVGSFAYHIFNMEQTLSLQAFLTVQRQTLGMFSFSLVAFFQTLLSIFLIFRSAQRSRMDAWEELE